jgi:hypothetical protein
MQSTLDFLNTIDGNRPFMPNTDVFALRRSGLNEFLFAPVGTEANGMTLNLVSVFARLGNDPWREAGLLAGLPKSEAIESLAQMIAGMPSCVWPLPAATTIATRLIALLPAQSETPGYSMTASPSAEKAGHLLKIVLVLLSIAFAAASASGIVTAGDVPKLDGSNVASFAEAPH